MALKQSCCLSGFLLPALAMASSAMGVPAVVAQDMGNSPQTEHGQGVTDDETAAYIYVDIVTELGTIALAVDIKNAPVTAQNFLNYVTAKKFDGMVFYRAMRLPWGEQPNGLIQAGLQGDPRKVLSPITHEPTSTTGLSHVAGAISMARYAPGTATADFSIMLSDMTGLDANPAATDPELQAGYAVFGHVVTGMEVARQIFEAPTSETLGEGVMRGQMLEPQIKVLSVRESAKQPSPADQPETTQSETAQEAGSATDGASAP